MRNYIRFTGVLMGVSLLIFGLSVRVFCQPDDKWRKQNDKGNRYEGRVTIEISAAPIELIAFYSFQEDFTGNDILRVGFYRHDDNLNVYLTAQELITLEHYWMEAKPQNWQSGWNEFGPWPVADVLGRLDITLDNLGVLVRLGKKGQTLEERLQEESGPVSPAILYHSSLPLEIEQYTAYFRPGRSLAGGRYELYKGCEGNRLIDDGPIGSQKAGIPFPVKFDLPKDWQGWVRFKIIVDLKGIVMSVPPSQEYCFYHISALDGSKSP